MSFNRTSRAANGQVPIRTPHARPDVAAAVPSPVQPADQVPSPGRVPATRTGAAWVALVAAALLAVFLIVFLVQNTRSTEISFLWMTTSTSLAVALLIASVGSVLLTLVLGTARIAQLRRRIRKQAN
jgi:uncharacterized integral membrane protein